MPVGCIRDVEGRCGLVCTQKTDGLSGRDVMGRELRIRRKWGWGGVGVAM